MRPPKPPKIAAIQIVAAQPTEVDRTASAQAGREEPLDAVYVVKLRLKEKPPVTSMAWRLYVGDELIPNYWEYEDGIYFTVPDRRFFTQKKGKLLRFSLDGEEFVSAGKKLTTRVPSVGAKTRSGSKKAGKLPRQAEVLKS